MPTGFTSSLDGPGTRLCQSGLLGQIGSVLTAVAEPADAASVSATTVAAPTRIVAIARGNARRISCVMPVPLSAFVSTPTAWRETPPESKRRATLFRVIGAVHRLEHLLDGAV